MKADPTPPHDAAEEVLGAEILAEIASSAEAWSTGGPELARYLEAGRAAESGAAFVLGQIKAADEARPGHNPAKETWFYEEAGVRRGPFTTARLQALFKDGALSRTTLVYCEGIAEPVRADELCALQHLFTPAPETAEENEPPAGETDEPRAGDTLAARIASESRRCPSCGGDLSPQEKFCPGCGQPVPLARACPKCGRETGAGARFCGHCGARIGRD